MELDGVRIGAPDPDEACRVYRLLLGVEPDRLAGGGWRFELGRGAVELVAGEPGLRSLGFVAGVGAWPGDYHGVPVHAVDPVAATIDAPDVRIDHVVVHTVHPERAIGLWRDTVGLRLALDRSFPARGLRLLFFRTAGITLEYASPLGAPADPGPDRLYGVSYRVPDLDACRARLLDADVDVSEVRPGMKPGTRVATVRNRTAGVPTLVIAPDAP